MAVINMKCSAVVLHVRSAFVLHGQGGQTLAHFALPIGAINMIEHHDADYLFSE